MSKDNDLVLERSLKNVANRIYPMNYICSASRLYIPGLGMINPKDFESKKEK